MYEPWYSKKGKFGFNQILDFHRSWISDCTSLIILEEIQDWEERWKTDIIRSYINEIAYREKERKYVKLIISQENENGLLEKLVEGTNDDDRKNHKKDTRSKRQILDGCFEQIEI